MPRFAANVTWLFGELPFLDRFAAAAKAGFKAVEIQFPYEHPAKEIRKRLDDNGLSLVLHNMPPGSGSERGLACLAERREAFRSSVKLALEYAAALGAPRLHCMAGTMPQEADKESLSAIYAENLRFAGEEAAKANVVVDIEPLNARDNPGYFLTRSAQAVELMGRIGLSNVRLQYDCYHMQIMEGDLVPSIQRLLPHIEHIQVADTPGRHEPGTGEINYDFVLNQLDAMGYGGWIGCEYKPKAGTIAGLDWIRRHIG